MSVLQTQNADQSFNNQKQKMLTGRSNLPELKITDLQLLAVDSLNVDFQLEVCKLVQANYILTELIKQAALEKYIVNERIHLALEQIRKLQAKIAAK